MSKSPDIAIIGAGLSGLCMGAQLKRAGIDSFTILEKADRVGGTWRDNRYPGVACDIPSHLYSYSFEMNPDWSRVYSPGAEIQEYTERCAEKYGLLPHLRVNSEVERLEFVGDRWRIELRSGQQLWADVAVGALGGLHTPRTPEIPGLADFRGVQFHSARWNEEHDLRGRRVAVIGSAASAVQIVPEIADQVAKLYVFQRTPNWVLPRHDRSYSERARRLFRRVPGLARLLRWATYGALESRFPGFVQGNPMVARVEQQCRDHLAAQVPDPELRRKLTPSYPPGCKRVLVSDDFYLTLGLPQVELVTAGIERIVPQGILGADGQTHEVDTIVLATGFEPFLTHSPLQVVGPGGLSLTDTWKNGIEAHRTVAVPGFPNFFLLLGPNSGLGHNSVIFMIEAQVRYVLQCIRALQRRGLAHLSPRQEASTRFNDRIQEDMKRTVWEASCKSWYQDDTGRVFALWPSSTLRYWWEMRRPDFAEYLQSPRSGAGGERA